MAKTKIFGPYRRLLAPKSHLAGYTSLWIAKDHLLEVTFSGYTDTYKRFYLRDIQGFLLEDSDRRFYWGLCLGLCLAGFEAIFLLNKVGWPTHLVFMAFFIIPMVVNWMRGPTCKLYLSTRVQTVLLRCCTRRARFEKTIEQLRPLIEAAQTDFVAPVRPREQAVAAGGGEAAGAVQGGAAAVNAASAEQAQSASEEGLVPQVEAMPAPVSNASAASALAPEALQSEESRGVSP